MLHIAFPDIKQYRHLITAVQDKVQYTGRDANDDPVFDRTKPLPTLTLEGTVKIHGANAAIMLDKTTGELWYQSREAIVTPEQDNMGFARFFSTKNLRHLFDTIPGNLVGIFGEWCGKGIQKKVGIAQVEKRFVVFGLYSDGTWLGRDAIAQIRDLPNQIYNIYDYPSYKITINFQNPEAQVAELEALTHAVELQCPVAAAFGVQGTGEGIVYKITTPGYEDPKFWVKIKGNAHKVSKEDKLVSTKPQLSADAIEFVDRVVSEARCEQSVSKLREKGLTTTRENLGEFLRWIYADVIKEESDSAEASGIDLDTLGGAIAAAGKKWFFANENKL